ncbi:MAG TPA: SPOR domain-containing protein [Accumulibacter sp.]|uniref:SPOR domain-containing protein n=1 Tax=Accumulibacter sp. TaxID=2053492 RepID=UPI002BDD24F1|nr:SPOR domain-containing protein [Accumulibacter sp.]HRD87025.1 SPOR domain-containing protein [Accumulibacter sp.]
MSAAPPLPSAIAASTADRPVAVERRLRRRMGIAGLLVVLLLLLLLADHLFIVDDPVGSGLPYTEPVPVRKKEAPPPPHAEPMAVGNPALQPAMAEPQASGAAIEPRMAAVEAAVAAGNEDPSGNAATHPPAAPPRPLSGPGLQTGVLADLQRAEAVQARFAQAGIPVGVEVRLHVGPFRDRAEAEAARRELQAEGVEAVIRPSVKAAKP